LFANVCAGYGTNVDVGEVLRGVLELVKRYSLRIDANYATLVVNVLCIEGLARRVCPTYNVLDAAKPLLQSRSHFLSTRTTIDNDDDNDNHHHGIGEICKRLRRKFRKIIIRILTPIVYMKKNWMDDQFFNRLREQQNKTQQTSMNTGWVLKRMIFLFEYAVRIFATLLAAQQATTLVSSVSFSKQEPQQQEISSCLIPQEEGEDENNTL